MRHIVKAKYVAIVAASIILILIFEFTETPTRNYSNFSNVISKIGDLGDISEIQSYLDSYKVEFRSERGFGSDRLDVYSFSLKNTQVEFESKLPDDELKREYENYVDMIYTEGGADVAGLINEIEKLMKADDFKHEYIKAGGTLGNTYKLYLFSANMNKGYCLILII